MTSPSLVTGVVGAMAAIGLVCLIAILWEAATKRRDRRELLKKPSKDCQRGGLDHHRIMGVR